MPAGQVHTVCPSALVCSVAGLKQVTQFVSSPAEQVTQAGLQIRQVEVTGSRYWPGGHLQVLSGYNTRNDVAHDTHPFAWIVVQILHVWSHGLHTPMESKAWPSGQVQAPVVGVGSEVRRLVIPLQDVQSRFEGPAHALHEGSHAMSSQSRVELDLYPASHTHDLSGCRVACGLHCVQTVGEEQS